MKIFEYLFRLIVILGVTYIAVSVAVAEPQDITQCPAGAKSCKILVLTPDEEQTLVGDNMIFGHAEWANRAGLALIIQAWRNKIAGAPQGKVAPAETPKK